MEKTKLSRINELARIKRERELTEAEAAEQAELRREYLVEWRRSAETVLNNTYVVTPDGVKHRLKRRGEK